MGHRRPYTIEERALIEGMAFDGEAPPAIVEQLKSIGCLRQSDTIKASEPFRQGNARREAGLARRQEKSSVTLGDMVITKQRWLVTDTAANGQTMREIPISLAAVWVPKGSVAAGMVPA